MRKKTRELKANKSSDGNGRDSNKKSIKHKDCDLNFANNKALVVNNYLSSRYHPRVRKVWGKSINPKRNLFLVFSYDHIKKLIKDDGARKIFLEIVKDAHAVPPENCQGIVVEKEDVKAKTLGKYGRYRLLFNKQEPKIISCESKEDLPEEDLSANEYYVPSAYGDFHK